MPNLSLVLFQPSRRSRCCVAALTSNGVRLAPYQPPETRQKLELLIGKYTG